MRGFSLGGTSGEGVRCPLTLIDPEPASRVLSIPIVTVHRSVRNPAAPASHPLAQVNCAETFEPINISPIPFRTSGAATITAATEVQPRTRAIHERRTVHELRLDHVVLILLMRWGRRR